MRFVGKRLPDILIGILIVVLAVGLGSLLLTQRNRAAAPVSVVPQAAIPAAPGADNSAPVVVKPIQTPAQPAVTTPPVVHQSVASPATTATKPAASQPPTASPVTDTSASAGDTATDTATGTATDTAQPVTTPPAANPPTTAPTAPTTTAPTTAQRPAQATPNVPVTTPTLEPPSGPAVDTSKPPVVTTPSPSTSAEPQPAPQASSHESAGARPVATSANRIPLRRDYRVSLGVFDNVQQALARTAAVQALGYKVYPINVGERVVVQVGPFASAQDAQQAQRDMARGYTGAVVLAPRNVQKPAGDAAALPTAPQATNSPVNSNQANSNQANTATAPQVATPAKNTTALNWQTPASSADTVATAPAPARGTAESGAATDSAQRPAPSGPVYLQVGAFDRQDSAQKLVGQLEALGYDATVQAPEGKKVTVLIGPFHGAALLRTETRLDSNGLEHFRVR